MDIQEAKENYYANEVNKEDSDNYVSELEKRNKEMLECLTKFNRLAECTGDKFANYSDVIFHDSKYIIEK